MRGHGSFTLTAATLVQVMQDVMIHSKILHPHRTYPSLHIKSVVDAATTRPTFFTEP